MTRERIIEIIETLDDEIIDSLSKEEIEIMLKYLKHKVKVENDLKLGIIKGKNK